LWSSIKLILFFGKLIISPVMLRAV